MEVLIEQDQIAPVRIVLELSGPTVDRPSAVSAPQESIREPAGNFLGHFEQRQEPARTGRTLHFEFITVEAVQVQQRPNQQSIDRHPYWAAPVGVAAEHSVVGFARQVLDLVLLTAGVKHKRMFQVMSRERADT